VLEIDVGGSSFSEFRKEYEGLHGKHKEDDKSLDDKYGKLTDEKDKYIRSKTKDVKVKVGDKEMSRNKTRYTMPGPLGLGGKLNTGDYSIEKTRVRIRDYGAKYLTPIFKKWEEDVNNNTTPDFHDIDLMIRGHSRGGVGASQGAMMLKSWIHDNYPHFEMFVQFHMIQYDPVPGGDVTTKSKFKDEAYERFDYEQYQGVHGGDFTIGGEKMRAVGRDSSSTVVYSMVNQDDFIHNTMFKPQEVLHAKRLILTPFNHDVGLDMEHIDETQTGGETKEKAHGMAYYDATSKKVYRNSGIDALGDGVYVMDENQIMVRVDSLAQLKSILALTMPEDFQKERQARILRAAASILGESADMDDYAPINHARTLALSDKIKDGVGFMASKYRKDVVKKMDALKKTLGSGFSADKNGVLDTTQIMGAYDEAIKACAVYVEKRSGDKFTDKGDQRLDEIRTLYTNLIKDREFVKKEAEKRRTDRTAATWDELFDTTPEIDISDANEMTGGMLRKEKSTGVSFIEKQDEKTEKKHGSAKGVAFSSRFAEMYSGVSGLYQGAQYAKLKNGDEESEGLVIEQLPPMSLEKLVKKYPEALIDSEIKEKVDKITAMDLVLGMDSLKKRKELRVTYTLDPKTKEVVIRDVIAPMHVSAFADGGTAVITEGESKLLRRLSSGAKEMIKKMNVDADRIKKWGLIDPEKIDVLVTRIQNLQKLL
ncbi:MAG: hypothetical protein II799_02930, partial [Lachnospiraceae bacterium]|nr:hypothetical protein [Lachnospiraceae bacterium]